VSEDLHQPNYSARRPGLDHDSEGSFTSLRAALSLKDSFVTFGSTDSTEIRSTDHSESSDDGWALAFVYATVAGVDAPTTISEDEPTQELGW
jgi:hypothetical protein